MILSSKASAIKMLIFNYENGIRFRLPCTHFCIVCNRLCDWWKCQMFSLVGGRKHSISFAPFPHSCSFLVDERRLKIL